MGGDRFIHLFLVVIISQCMHISKHHIVYLKYTQFSFAINKQTRWREVIAKALVPFSGLVCLKGPYVRKSTLQPFPG